MYLMTSQVRIADARLEVRCSPDHGFSLDAIVDRKAGADALWSRPNHEPAACSRALGPSGSPSVETFADIWTGGWFEMFPDSGFPTPGDPSSLLHGEVMRLPWEVLEQTPASVLARVRLVRRPLELTRRLEIRAGRLHITEKVMNVGTHGAVEFAWGHHPCLARATFARGRIELPVRRAYVPAPFEPELALLRAGPIENWPWASRPSGQDIDASAIPAQPDGYSCHVCVELDAGWARVTAPAFDLALRIDFPVRRFPHVLLWRELGGPPRWPLWGDGDTFAIEFASVPGRSTPEAREAGALSVLGPGATHDADVVVAWEPLRAS